MLDFLFDILSRLIFGKKEEDPEKIHHGKKEKEEEEDIEKEKVAAEPESVFKKLESSMSRENANERSHERDFDLSNSR